MKLVLNSAFLLLFCKFLFNKLQDNSKIIYQNFETCLRNTCCFFNIDAFALISNFSIESLQLEVKNGEAFFANKM